MKQFRIFASIFLFYTFSISVFADVYSEYKKNAEIALTQIKSHQFEVAYKTLNLLSDLGFQVMDLFEKKKPECLESLKIFRSDYSIMESLSVEEIERLYHDGERFPLAPKNCYFGRTLVVHPVMNKVRVKNPQNWTAELEVTATNEIQETIAYLEYIKKLLN